MRKMERLHSDWQFFRGETEEVWHVSPGGTHWQTVRVPHDWAAKGPFFAGYDAQFTVIENNGETEATLHKGRTGGLPHSGYGIYQRHLLIPEADRGKCVYLEFDGVMSHSRVFVNGIEVGYRPYGYSSFVYEITEQVQFGGKNLLTVQVHNKPYSSRWYPGAGIYRDVRLVTVEQQHILPWSVWIRSKTLANGEALVSISLKDAAGTGCFSYEIKDPDGIHVASGDEKTGEIRISGYEPWDVESPRLYQAIVRVADSDGMTCDEQTISFGIRSVVFDSERGMSLNGRPFVMNGVCMHHDLGPLGAAFSLPAARRQLEKLRSIGVNAIRFTHNPPAPQMLDLCDRLGFLAIDEAFDAWQIGKIENDYHTHFEEWHRRDLVDMIHRDRNHPCVILWSIGNEILEQREPDGWRLARNLQEIVHETDPDRPCTAGLSFEVEAIRNGMGATLDVPGFNYKPHRYQEYHEQLPGKPLYGSETASTLSSRGEYYFPVREGCVPHPGIQCSSYDVEYPSWASTPDKEFHFQDRCPFVMGEFVWTGFDYLGEPCPYDAQWPAHSSYFGIFDLVGLPKDRAWLYRSRWRKEVPTLHLLPHWNFPTYAGKTIPVHVYTSFEEAELFLNGKTQGRKCKIGSYRLCWDQVVYEPGELKVVAYDGNGNAAMTSLRKTTGAAEQIRLELENTAPLLSDGEDLAFVQIAACDGAGNVHPTASNRIRLELDGPAEFAGIGNGDATSLETFDQDHIHLFNGMAVVYVRSIAGKAGTVRLTARADHLTASVISFDVISF